MVAETHFYFEPMIFRAHNTYEEFKGPSPLLALPCMTFLIFFLFACHFASPFWSTFGPTWHQLGFRNAPTIDNIQSKVASFLKSTFDIILIVFFLRCVIVLGFTLVPKFNQKLIKHKCKWYQLKIFDFPL